MASVWPPVTISELRERSFSGLWCDEMSGWWTPDGSWTHVESSPLTPPILALCEDEVRWQEMLVTPALISSVRPPPPPLSGAPATQQANSASIVSNNTNIGHGVPVTIYTAGHVTLSTHLQFIRCQTNHPRNTINIPLIISSSSTGTTKRREGVAYKLPWTFRFELTFYYSIKI